MHSKQVNYVDSEFDKNALSITPTLMKPYKGGISWPLETGCYRFIIANDGLYIEGRSDVLHASFRVSDLNGAKMPYGNHKSFCNIKNGLLPDTIKNELLKRCIKSGEQEYAAYVSYETTEYIIIEPTTVSASTSHISYQTDQNINSVLIDIHSHGLGEAYFSPTDDISDRHGIYLAVVFGRCSNTESITIKSRIVIHGHFCDLDWEPWEGAE